MEMRCATRVSAYSCTVDRGRVGELKARYRTGWSDGLTFCSDGGEGMSSGSRRRAREMADCTSWAAASMSRSSTNLMVIRVLLVLLVEVITSTPGIVENSRSSGRATAEAMVSGLAPGRLADTWMVG